VTPSLLSPEYEVLPTSPIDETPRGVVKEYWRPHAAEEKTRLGCELCSPSPGKYGFMRSRRSRFIVHPRLYIYRYLIPQQHLQVGLRAADGNMFCNVEGVPPSSLVDAVGIAEAPRDKLLIPLPISGVTVQTLITRCLGPILVWPWTLAETLQCEFNFLHFTPVQKLGGSGSAYRYVGAPAVASPALPAPSTTCISLPWVFPSLFHRCVPFPFLQHR
jgi:hypothetical protein